MPSIDDEPRLQTDLWNLDLPIPYHMDRYLCLYVDEDCVSSLIGTPGEEIAIKPRFDQTKQGKGSYIVAVDPDYAVGNQYERGSNPEPYRGWAKIATTVVFTELCAHRVLVNSSLDLDRVHQQSYHPRFRVNDGIWRS